MDRKPYDSDLNASEKECIAPYVAQKPGPGRKRTVDIMEIVKYQLKKGRGGLGSAP